MKKTSKNNEIENFINENSNKLISLYEFLENNHNHNKSLQLISVLSATLPFKQKEEKFISILKDVANTQTEPNLDALGKFWEELLPFAKNIKSIGNFNDFLRTRICNSSANKNLIETKHCLFFGSPDNPLELLFTLLSLQHRWGDKTAALFVKYVVMCHNWYEDNEYCFFNHPMERISNTTFLTPVDSVIRHVFDRINERSSSKLIINNGNQFKKINFALQAHNRNKNIDGFNSLIWDDLWYWGFITQRKIDNERKTALNYEKYMSWKTSSPSEWNKTIKPKANEFIKLLETN